MTNPEFSPLLLAALCYLAGFVSAIWLAVSIDKDARRIAEKDAEDNLPQGG
jgi:hypothetical protein